MCAELTCVTICTHDDLMRVTSDESCAHDDLGHECSIPALIVVKHVKSSESSARHRESSLHMCENTENPLYTYVTTQNILCTNVQRMTIQNILCTLCDDTEHPVYTSSVHRGCSVSTQTEHPLYTESFVHRHMCTVKRATCVTPLDMLSRVTYVTTQNILSTHV